MILVLAFVLQKLSVVLWCIASYVSYQFVYAWSLLRGDESYLTNKRVFTTSLM